MKPHRLLISIFACAVNVAMIPNTFADDAHLNGTTAAAEAPNAVAPGHAHRGTAPAPTRSDNAGNSPSNLNPGPNNSASGMGTTDNTMSSSTGSEGISHK